jgi:hypothetical protein
MRFRTTISGSCAVAATAIVLAGCGGGTQAPAAAAGTAPGSAQTQQGQQGGGRFAQLTTSQRACLQKAGLGGPRPGGGSGQPPGGGQPPSSADRQARFQKLAAAFKKCGIQLPSRPGAPGGTAPGGTQN